MPRTTDPAAAVDLLRVDDELSEEERLVRDTVRDFAAKRIMPHVADWFEAGTLPRELAPELGQLGLLGMHLTGYGCAGMGADRLRRRLPRAGGRRLRACAAWSRCRARWPCSRSGNTARRSRSRNGCRGWRPARPSAASG